jgi:hypothetical protein
MEESKIMSKPKLTHAQCLAIAKKEEEARIKDLLEQCGMLCDDISRVSQRNAREEKMHSRYAYFDVEEQKRKRKKDLAI